MTATNRDDADAPRVLIVDDDYSIRELLATGLEMEGFRTATAPDGFSGLRSAVKEPPDAVVLDIMMPGRDGFTVLDGIRSRDELADIPILVLTARSGAHDLQRAADAGADHVITKPFAFDHLVWQLREMLARPRRHRPQASTSSEAPLARRPRPLPSPRPSRHP